VGSDPLEKQIRQIKSDMHLFGHTHLPVDLEIDHLRYLQWSLGMQVRRGEYMYTWREIDEDDIEYVVMEMGHLRYLEWSLGMQVRCVECKYIWMEMDEDGI